MRAVFDVAVLIRATFGSHRVVRLLRQANSGAFALIWAEPHVQELIETSRKSRMADRVNRGVLDEVVAFLKEESVLVSIAPPSLSAVIRMTDICSRSPAMAMRISS